MIRMPHSTPHPAPATRVAERPSLVVVKVGGGLLATDGALDQVCATLGAAAGPIVVVPGGGPFADAVRTFDRRVGLSADAAHWMALLAMDQYAHVLAERQPCLGQVYVQVVQSGAERRYCRVDRMARTTHRLRRREAEREILHRSVNPAW